MLLVQPSNVLVISIIIILPFIIALFALFRAINLIFLKISKFDINSYIAINAIALLLSFIVIAVFGFNTH